MSLPFGLDLVSVIVGMLFGAYVWPYIWSMLYGLFASFSGKKSASPAGI